MAKRFNFKGKDYRVDENGDIYDDNATIPIKVGKMDDDVNFTIKTGPFTEETGRFESSGKITQWTDDVRQTGPFGTDRGKAGEGKCILATACLEYAGLPDNCYELQTMRKFRDEFVSHRPEASTLVEDYYRTAPVIVQCIQLEDNPHQIFQKLINSLKNAISLIEAGRNFEALLFCRKEFELLKKNYNLM